MRILLSYIGYPVGAGKFMKKALKKLGYEVVHFGPDAKGFLPWQPQTDFSGYADSPDIALEYPYISSYPMAKALERAGKVDLVIQMDANFHLEGKAPVPNVVWMVDNHVAKFDISVKDADIVFGAHSWGFHHEDKNFIWLPCAYSPEDHFQTISLKETDLMFLGVLYPHRVQLLNTLAPYGRVSAGMGVLGKEYNDLYNSARMGMCFSFCGDVPMRVFENAAQGLLVFSDTQLDLGKLGLKDGIHYVGFGSLDEAVSKFKMLLSDPGTLTQIAQNGKKALAGETYESRVATILSYI